MSFWQLLYQLLITPLGLLFETIFRFAYSTLEDVGLSIIPLSLVMNFLLLPFYNRAAVIQKEEHEREQRLAPGIEHIKKTFKGDKRFMILQTYYRQNHYSPIYTIRSSFSLLLQIPFFMAAYRFLSNYSGLQGTSFGILKDLGKPDQLFSIGGFAINVLPILMTIINIISSSIYTKKDSSLREKIQLYGMALLFLVILYRSPSGLVFYWTLNNTFSLVKNIVYKSKNKRIILDIIFAALSVGSFIFAALIIPDPTKKFSGIIIGLLFLIPILLGHIDLKKFIKQKEVTKEEGKIFTKTFLFSGLFMSSMSGFLIPSAVISSSPAEFIFLSDFHNPLRYLLVSSLVALGVFVVWCGLFYYLSSLKARKYFSIAMCILAVGSAVNYLFFGKQLPFLQKSLVFDDGMYFSPQETLINSAAVIGMIAVLVVVWKKLPKVLPYAMLILFLGTASIGVYNCTRVTKNLPDVRQSMEKPTFTLSRDKENVVVIMIDRAMSCYVPYIFQEKPELEKQFEGFTFYPNTLSFGATTNIGTPGLFGGYEYQPLHMNARSDLSLGEKQNEALRVMPIVFDDAGYDVTVCNPPYAGYQVIPDISIYDDHPDIDAYVTENGQYSSTPEIRECYYTIWNRNFFYYGFTRSLPVILQEFFYDDGSFNDPDRLEYTININQFWIGNSKAFGMNDSFLDHYQFLKEMPDITTVEDKDAGTFIMMNNSTPHDVAILQEPEYEPAMKVDNTEYDEANQDRFTVDGRTMVMQNSYAYAEYQSNMAALIQLGNWFDYLRSEGVYDNTKIILVSDHGFFLDHFDDLILGYTYADEYYFHFENVIAFNAFLMVKDFDSNDAFKSDDTFMTNADTPVLAFENVIDNPVNPSTGVPITNDEKFEDELHVMYTIDWRPTTNNGNQFSEGVWFAVSNGDIFNTDNWVDEGKGIHEG